MKHTLAYVHHKTAACGTKERLKKLGNESCECDYSFEQFLVGCIESLCYWLLMDNRLSATETKLMSYFISLEMYYN